MEEEYQLPLREFISNYESGKYNSSDKNTMIDAGWYDWDCEDSELKQKLDDLFPKVKQISQSSLIDIDKMYVMFRNMKLRNGTLNDDFRICEIGSGDYIYVIYPSYVSKKKTLSEVWGQINDFDKPLASGTWQDVEKYFS